MNSITPTTQEHLGLPKQSLRRSRISQHSLKVCSIRFHPHGGVVNGNAANVFRPPFHFGRQVELRLCINNGADLNAIALLAVFTDNPHSEAVPGTSSPGIPRESPFNGDFLGIPGEEVDDSGEFFHRVEFGDAADEVFFREWAEKVRRLRRFCRGPAVEFLPGGVYGFARRLRDEELPPGDMAAKAEELAQITDRTLARRPDLAAVARILAAPADRLAWLLDGGDVADTGPLYHGEKIGEHMGLLTSGPYLEAWDLVPGVESTPVPDTSRGCTCSLSPTKTNPVLGGDKLHVHLRVSDCGVWGQGSRTRAED